MTIAWLNGLDRGAQSVLIFDGLSHEAQARTEGSDLRARGAFRTENAHGGGFGVFQTRACAHAEGVVDYKKYEAIARNRSGVAIHERIREGEDEQEQHREAQREQQEVAQTAVAR